ncbi:hypothetical protein PsYK624_158990 [Phanerochaete sordida]|uniref:Uncharacterized protein n=1 Tax=Phanerochaete sordida TaxID=48140 RepID=A0A9P3LLF0_9APHY|nr:hypothetical protein PsYK624_158990 [Phanerochaete sordida]
MIGNPSDPRSPTNAKSQRKPGAWTLGARFASHVADAPFSLGWEAGVGLVDELKLALGRGGRRDAGLLGVPPSRIIEQQNA